MPANATVHGPRGRAVRRALEVLLAVFVLLAVSLQASVGLATHTPPEEECTSEAECSAGDGSAEGESGAPPPEEEPTTEATPTTEPQPTTEEQTTQEQSAPVITEESVQVEQESMRSYINGARRNGRDRRLKMRAKLVEVARRHSARMANSGGIYHNPNLAGDLRRLRWRIAGENVGVGSTIENLHRAFMDSPPHRANVLRDSFRYIGVGVVHAKDRLWITIVFMG